LHTELDTDFDKACLNAPEGVGPDGTPTSIAAIPTVKKERKAKDKDGLAIRPLKLDAASIQNLEHSATAAGHGVRFEALSRL
jgi:hypothetical protein